MKRRRHESRGHILFPLFIALVVGGVLGWLLRDRLPPARAMTEVATMAPLAAPVSEPPPQEPQAVAPAATPAAAPSVTAPAQPAALSPTGSQAPPASELLPATIEADPIAELRRHSLRLPLDNIDVEKMKGGFFERRDRGGRPHEASDLMAARMTPVHAVESGRIARLFLSKAGGITVYQFDPTERYCYYYAHLQQYAAGLAEGQTVKAGDVVGYVGSSGNAAPDAPHLHFAIFKLTDAKRWWEGTPLDPYLVFKK